MRNTNNRIEKLKQKALNDPNSKIYKNYLKKIEEDKKLRERNIKKSMKENTLVEFKRWMRIIGKDNNQTENEWIKEKEELLEQWKSLEGHREKLEEQKKKKIENALKRERAKLGIGEDSDIELVRSLVDLTKRYISENEAYLYFKCWSLKDGTKWYKLGVTVDLERREREQNVLPVPSQTLEQVSFDSQDAAYAAEKAFLQVLEEFKIKDANNRELMELNPTQVKSIISAMQFYKDKGKDLKNKSSNSSFKTSIKEGSTLSSDEMKSNLEQLQIALKSLNYGEAKITEIINFLSEKIRNADLPKEVAIKKYNLENLLKEAIDIL